MDPESYRIFYNNLEAFANEGEGEYWEVDNVLKKLAYCFRWEVKDDRFFNKKNKRTDKPYKCICGVNIKDPYPFHVLGRPDKKLYVGSKCIERVCKHDKYEVPEEFTNSIFNKCCHRLCRELIRKDDREHLIVLNYCKQHRQGFKKYLCSGCGRWSLYNEGRPTQSYCELCIEKSKRDANKYKCKYCEAKIKSDKYDKCYNCFSLTMEDCEVCGKKFDSHMGKYEKCYSCHFT
jgi:hypothetical protein